jgi:hypothetical protein
MASHAMQQRSGSVSEHSAERGHFPSQPPEMVRVAWRARPGLVTGELQDPRLRVQQRAATLRQVQRLLGNRAAQGVVQRFVAPASAQAPNPPETAAPPARLPNLNAPAVPLDVTEPATDASCSLRSALPTPPPDPALGQAGAAATARPIATSGSSPQQPSLAPAHLIHTDAQRAEAEVARITAAHGKQIGAQFGRVRRELSTGLTRAGAALGRFIGGKQAEIRATSAALLRTAQGTVADAIEAAVAQADQTRAAVTSFVEATSASLQTQVQGITTQIGAFLNALPVPNLPGVAQLRTAAASLLGRAAAAVSGGLATARGLIAPALQNGMRLIGSALAGIRQLANSALAQVAGGIQRGLQAVLAALRRVGAQVIGAVRTLLTNTVLPTINRAERQVMQGLAKAQRQAVTAIRANRDQHLQALTTALHAKAGAVQPPTPRPRRPAMVPRSCRQSLGRRCGTTAKSCKPSNSAPAAPLARSSRR